MKRIRLSDIVIIGLIIFFVASVMLVSFASKAIRYQQTNGAVTLTVQKKEYSVFAQTNGILVTSNVGVGQHVRKGDVIGQLSNSSLDRQISLLSALTGNDSAQVQLSQLEVEKASQTLYAPTDGVVASAASQGEDINNAQRVASIYSDTSVQLIGRFDYNNYNLFQQNTAALSAVSLRNNQVYSINYGGTYQETSAGQNDTTYVSLFFTFDSSSDAVNVLQNEKLLMKVVNNSDSNPKPIEKLINVFRDSIFNTNSTIE